MPMEESEKAGSLCVAKYGIWTIPKNASEKPLKNPKYRGGASTQIQRRRYLLGTRTFCAYINKIEASFY